MQTMGLVVSDSFGNFLRDDAPAIAGVIDFFQMAFNPDKQTPEKCLFPTSLVSKLLVEAVLQPVSEIAPLRYSRDDFTRLFLTSIRMLRGVRFLHPGCYCDPLARLRVFLRTPGPVLRQEGAF